MLRHRHRRQNPFHLSRRRSLCDHPGYAPSVAFPAYPGKHALEPCVTPSDWLRYLRELYDWEGLPHLAGVILTYSPGFFDRVAARPEWRELESPLSGSHSFFVTGSDDHLVGMVGRFGVGSPAAANRLEDLAAAGVTRFISIGMAGGIQPDLEVSDLVVCTEAVRDEGVSHHYLESGERALPSAELTSALAASLRELAGPVREGPSWTIDAPYRETVDELHHYRSSGVLTVEMEAAALAAVARVRQVQFATAFTVSDSLARLPWRPQFHNDRVAAGLDRLLEAAVTTLRAVPAL